MKYKAILAVFLISIFLVLLFWSPEPVNDTSEPDIFFGVDAVSDSVEDIKTLIDEVKSYTNLFLIGSTAITDNETKLNEVCQYAYENGLYFMTYTHITDEWPQNEWVDYAKQRWGERFLGLYAFDEAGGRQIDWDE